MLKPKHSAKTTPPAHVLAGGGSAAVDTVVSDDMELLDIPAFLRRQAD